MDFHIGAYQVPTKIYGTMARTAVLSPANLSDMPTNWTFPWRELWRNNRIDGLTIVKMSIEDEVWGLVQYGIFPRNNPSIVVIDHLETNPVNRGKQSPRLVEPVGKWLIWYCVNVGLKLISQSNLGDERLVLLFSKPRAFEYYDSKIGMNYQGTKYLSPGEKVHEFIFTQQGAFEYSTSQQEIWGSPTPIDS
ncbi:hypothetical protein BCD64_08430 [Nostoc sp. MBR 210]|uniref:hypothetical protein n=1 Tax=Nostoc sp. FACHB-280 TaxID=2692839 RepID=UPI00081DD594|nr:hypothetical protein [Nostoc sp. FACHB-280]MBD2493110.1 hypothetical protein [Nostoc sp. FACHB-280]OCQ92761.1 hypothetical protein BCD64_08430 [Nostoc sp. MBR 210]